jgi:hypothetical protein
VNIHGGPAGDFDALAVEGDFEFLSSNADPANADPSAASPNFDVVLAVHGEVMMDQDAAAGAERQSVDVRVLIEIAGHFIGGGEGIGQNVSDGHATDLGCRGRVALDQSG